MDGEGTNRRVKKGGEYIYRNAEREKTITSHEARSQIFHPASRGRTMVIVVALTIMGLRYLIDIDIYICKDKATRAHF
jgi:hypothetical protein